MKIKKIFIIGLFVLLVAGCTNIQDLSYDNIINHFAEKEKSPNTFKKGYQYYVPTGLFLEDSGLNYSVFSSDGVNYYLYVDIISYINKNDLSREKDDNSIYSKSIKNGKKKGYVQIKLYKNNQYLIEIMYNYAKIEVMVEENLINKVLINSVSILNSIKYNDVIIERVLNDDELSYTEEKFELFKDKVNNNDILEYEENVNDMPLDEEIKDTDFIN